MAKLRSKPSSYPPLAFHAIRTCSLVSSLVVSAILSFFVYHLKHDNFKIPWTLLVVSSSGPANNAFLTLPQLFGVALLSLTTLSLTLGLYLCHSLAPLFNLTINFLLMLLWILGISLLGWNMAGTLGHVCSSENWGSDAGVMVCRLYKALFSFTLLGAISAVAMVVLDFRVRSQQNSLGKYNQMRESAYDLKPSREAFSSGALGGHHDEQVEPWQRAGHEPNDYNTRDISRERIRSEHFGYTSPSEQTHYDSGIYGARDRQ